MPTSEEPAEKSEINSSDGGRVLQALINHDPSIWSEASVRDMTYNRPGKDVRSEGADKIISGTSERGALITVTDTDFTRSENKQKLADAGTPYVSTYQEWETTDRIKGVQIVVETDDRDGKKKTVTMFLPDGLPPPDVYQRPLEITVKNAFGQKTLTPDDDDFQKTKAEIKYYLGDNVQWGSPDTSSAEA